MFVQPVQNSTVSSFEQGVKRKEEEAALADATELILELRS